MGLIQVFFFSFIYFFAYLPRVIFHQTFKDVIVSSFMRYERSAGVVIFNNGKFLLLHYEAGHWEFVKGHVEKGEDEITTIKRETKEETGIKDLKIIPGFKESITYFFKRNGELTKKRVDFYLAETKEKKIKLSHEHIGYKWLNFEEAVEQVTFKNAKDVLRKAHVFLELRKLSNKIKRCKKCPLWKSRKKAVPGEGNYKAKLMIIGEAPGPTEDKIGKPFVGNSGRFLIDSLKKIGIKREDVYITNVIKCFPPGKRRPKSSEIKACSYFLETEISLVKPRIVLTLGRTALKRLLGKDSLRKHHGKIFKKDRTTIFPTFHPAAARRFPLVRHMFLKDIKKLQKLLTKL